MPDFNLHELISAPIIAMNEAEAQNSARYVELLEDYAFDTSEKDGTKTLSTLAFSYARAEPDGTATLQSVEIPLIQFLPISGIAIDQAKLNYALKINPAAEKSSGRLRMLGRLAENNESHSPLSGNLNIELHLKQVDIPQGVLSLLETSQQAAQQRTVKVDEPAPLRDVDPVVTVPDKFVDFEIVDRSAKTIRAGEDYTYVLRAKFAEELQGQDASVSVLLGAQPRPALEFDGEDNINVRHNEEFKVRFLTSPRIEKYKPATQVKLVLLTKATLGADNTKTHIHTITLPRAKAAPQP